MVEPRPSFGRSFAMIISNSRKFIFVHVAKAGGTSVTKSLEPSLRWNDFVIGDFGGRIKSDRCRRLLLGKHSAAREIRNALGEEVWDNYFTFAFARHPYQRAVSLFFYVKRIIGNKGVSRYLRHFPFLRNGPDAFWGWPATRAYLEGKNLSGFLRLAEEYGARGMRPQANYFLDESGGVMVDHVGKLEQMEAEMEFLAGKLGLPKLQAEQGSRAPSPSWRDFLTAEDREFLFGVFQKDFDLLDYDPEL